MGRDHRRVGSLGPMTGGSIGPMGATGLGPTKIPGLAGMVGLAVVLRISVVCLTAGLIGPTDSSVRLAMVRRTSPWNLVGSWTMKSFSPGIRLAMPSKVLANF